ncbi:Uncharacterised protein [uncultured archaeon]|nr:Uncharacterised protein [uncultured archaeon]
MSKKRVPQDNEQLNIFSSKSDELIAKNVTLSNEYIATFTQIIFQD